jgi:hypothetical protein
MEAPLLWGLRWSIGVMLASVWRPSPVKLENFSCGQPLLSRGAYASGTKSSQENERGFPICPCGSE